MTYIAKHYVRLPGANGTVCPGERFEAELDLENEERLIRLNAIEKVLDETSVIETEMTNTEPVEEIEEEVESEEDDEETVETEAPVIDVMDGFVEPEAEKPKGRRKSK